MNEELLKWIYPKKYGYTWYTTLTYSLLFFLGIYIIFKILKKLKIKIDYKLAFAIFPFILIGSTLRTMRDALILTSLVFVTPQIYFLISLLTLTILFISKTIEQKFFIPYEKISFISGIIVEIFLLLTLPIYYFKALIYLIPLLTFFFLLVFNSNTKIENKILIFSQAYDASISYTAMKFFGYKEQHVLPNILFSLAPLETFLIIKPLIAILSIILLDYYIKQKDLNKYLKMIITIIGIAQGTRNLLNLLCLI
ncbi:MAG: hypothetical protein B6U78_00440 [Candidatus Aenigmarchaeota archaeon ex4484_224]|nr:MAG: hypothetical protein B6U78_00440 [Candidatus Aenigmarchaeota archaeon ex4484_224]